MTATTTLPKRIQRRRVKGWRKPANTVIVDRTSHYGNPFKIADAIANGFADNEHDARKACLTAFDEWLDGEDDYSSVEPERRQRILDDLHLLAGKDLACPCAPGDPCHGDSLILRAAHLVVKAVTA
ncbi:DUF4326 domain-containing protein [Micromonospora wenchangensis]|uniref:DUF4326 domain-containing protein n=1 Tax=Micromonospora wenchangensis TaxID=1185415 RepID=UPI00380D5531